MHITFGEALFGKVDQIERRCYVATSFFHISTLPILPMETYLVLDESPNEPHWESIVSQIDKKKIKTCLQRDREVCVVQIGNRSRSVYFAWLRFLLIWGTVLLALSTFLLPILYWIEGTEFHQQERDRNARKMFPPQVADKLIAANRASPRDQRFGPASWLMCAGGALACYLLLLASYRVTYSNQRRARELVRVLEERLPHEKNNLETLFDLARGA